MKNDIWDDPTYSYEAFDGEGELLYVGVARNWAQRWVSHSERSEFFPAVRNVKVTLHNDRATALEYERDAILANRPPFNRLVDLGPFTPVPPIGGRRTRAEIPGPAMATLGKLDATMPLAVWREACSLPDSTFYRHRRLLLDAGAVVRAEGGNYRRTA